MADTVIMVASELDALRQSAMDSLAQISRSTEEVYLRMGEAFPALVRELDASFGQAGQRLKNDLMMVIDDALAQILDHQKQFEADDGESRQLLSQFDQQLKSLENLATWVGEIREDSVLMELFSLNALVIAVKAGPAGLAFSCITSELKKLSNQTMVLTDTIGSREKAVGQTFQEFQSDLSRMGSEEQQAIVQFLERIQVVFQHLGKATSDLMGGMASIAENAAAVKAPLVEVMVDIQNQDRIRQSLDHVLLSLKKLDELDPSGSLEDRLDEVSFLEILPDLSSLVLEEVSGQIRQNRDSFHRCVGEARQQMERLEADLAAYLGRHLVQGSHAGLQAAYREGDALFSTFINEAQSLIRFRERLLRKSVGLQTRVGDLVDSLGAFSEVLSKFRNIDLAARIQVARQAALAPMRANAAGMSSLTKKIETDVDRATGVTMEFYATVGDHFGRYRDHFASRMRQDELFNDQLHQMMEKVRSSQEVLDRSLRESRVFQRSFVDLFDATEADLSRLDLLLKEIEHQVGQFRLLKARFSTLKAQLLEEGGLTEWKLANDKLKTMVSRFTIFTHKKFAAELGDFEVEQGVESGEVTLF